MSPLLQQVNDFSMTHDAYFCLFFKQKRDGTFAERQKPDLEPFNTSEHFLDKVIHCVYL